MNQEQLKNVIRENFKNDEYNNLIGFCEVENFVTCKILESCVPLISMNLEFNTGDMLVLWQDSNGDFRIDEIEEFYKCHIDV